MSKLLDEATATSQNLKWVQYIPNSFGTGKMDLDNAIKSIYKPKYTNIAGNPDLRQKFGATGQELSPGKKIDSYLYGG